MTSPRLPFAGIRILDLTMVWAGPSGTRLLADMGAECIKVESARSWDMLRSLHFLGGETERWWNKAAYFNHNNRNKYACTLDLQTERPRAGAAPGCDVRHRVRELPRGCHFEAAAGLRRPARREGRHHPCLDAEPREVRSGVASRRLRHERRATRRACVDLGYSGDGPHKSQWYGDPNAGAIAAAAAIAALHHRSETGEGQHVEVAQWEAMIGNLGEFVLGYQMDGDTGERIGNRHISRVQGVYECVTPDEWLAVSVGSDAEFAALCGVLEAPELARDPRFADVASRHRHHDDLDAIIDAWAKTRSQGEAAHTMQAAGVPAAPVLKVPRLMADEHLRSRGFWESVAHTDAGTWDIEGPVWRMSRRRRTSASRTDVRGAQPLGAARPPRPQRRRDR